MNTKKNLEAESLLKQLISVDITTPKRREKETRFDLPKLPKGDLSSHDKWKAIQWNINTANAHGTRALQSMVIALAKTIQAQILTDMFFDVRHGSSQHYDISDLLWGLDLPIRADGASIRTLLRKRRAIKPVNLSHASVIPQVWERWRMARSFQNLGKDAEWGEWKQTSNIFAVAWTPWPIIWVSNGNHSTMAAIVTHGGLIKATETYDATNLLNSVYTDGVSWLRVDDNSVIAPVSNMVMAAIFEIGKRMLPKRNLKPLGKTSV